MLKEKFTSVLALAALMVLAAGELMAGPIGPPPPTATPIDGGLSLVIAACAGYGAKKIYDSRKK